MDDVERLISDPEGEAARDLTALGGVLTCFSCNETRAVTEHDYKDDVPMCCGEPMRHITAEELGAESTSPLSDRALTRAIDQMRGWERE